MNEFEQVAETVSRFNAQMKRRHAEVEALVEDVRRSLPDVSVLSDWVRAQVDLTRMLQRLHLRTQAWGAFLIQMGWPPTTDLAAGALDQLADGLKRGELTEGDVEDLFLEFYDEPRVRGLLAGWADDGQLSHRLPILDAAVEAHIRGEYLLSVPALLPQVEGVLAERFGHQGRLSGKRLERYLQDALSEQNPFDQAARVFVAKRLLESFAWASTTPEFSRHAVLHGADVGYGSRVNSLRAILTFDYIHCATRGLAAAP